ncbi:ANTAR domain-containing response regulator [Actinophytocola sp.]|uniref:ANTAR domain-containing response regulator n=1 Tax=Actinophytocola sp. TaxID=1872138 RepID=UPI003D6BE2A6
MTEQDVEWRRDKERFVAHQDEARPPGDPVYSPLARQFVQLGRQLLAADTVAGVLAHVARAAVEVVPAADLVSVTLRSSDGHLHTPVATDPLGTELDELQDRYDEGPCLDTARSPGPAYRHSGDLANDAAWPRFGPAAAAFGFHSVLSTALLPDVMPPRLSGALNVFAREPGALGGAADHDRVLLLATHASLAVSSTEAVRLAELREAQLRRAIDSRDVIGQAKGILMHRRGITAEEAFDLLRRTSQELNVKLAELARTITTRHTELDLPG